MSPFISNFQIQLKSLIAKTNKNSNISLTFLGKELENGTTQICSAAIYIQWNVTNKYPLKSPPH